LVKTWGSPALFACCAVAMLVWCLVALPMQTPGRAAPVQLAE
jgi:low affinity Fe/Cu permease